MCGEQTCVRIHTQSRTGSSPRVRRTGFVSQLALNNLRFIPACAGNSSPATVISRTPSVHPRVCGVQVFVPPGDTLITGSSPRVRGTARRKANHNPPKRFIPACAGNSLATPTVSADCPVHPRVCGEQNDFEPRPVRTIGSSPRVRGTAGIRVARRDQGVPTLSVISSS